MTTGLLFGGPDDPASRSVRTAGTAEILITVKTTPNPSATYGETVCVAGIRTDTGHPGWTRLYPINFRQLDGDRSFKKYDLIRVPVRPQSKETRYESWRPSNQDIEVIGHLDDWRRRGRIVHPYIGGSTCEFVEAATADPTAQSLALIRPVDVGDFRIAPHPGWTKKENAVLEQWANQGKLFGDDKRPALQAPRFIGKYKYRCEHTACNGHEQSLIDWEFTAFQYNQLRGMSDSDAIKTIHAKFFDQICSDDRDTCFYIGNQAKRRQTFSILGLWWPSRP